MAGWAARGGSTRQWRKLRAAVLRRDGYVCRMRRPGCEGRATTVDHVVPLVLGGTDDPSNLRAACASCNASAGGALSTARGRLGTPSRRWV